MKKTLLCALLAVGALSHPGYGATPQPKKPGKTTTQLQLQQARIVELEERIQKLTREMTAWKESVGSEVAILKAKAEESAKRGEETSLAAGQGDDRCSAEREELADLDSRLEDVERIAGKIHHTGWYDFVFRNSNKPGDHPMLDQAHLYLNFDARLDKVWRSFMELEIEHSPTASGGGSQGTIELDRGYIERACRRNAKLRIGKFFVPLGLYTREHWAISTDSILKPIHDDNGYVPNSPVGVLYQGSTRSAEGGAGNIEYTAFLSNGSEMYATNKTRDDKPGGGADLRYQFGEDHQDKIGFSFYRQNNHAQAGRLERNSMAYLDYHPVSRLLVRLENFHQERDSRYTDVHVLYAGLKYQLTKKVYANLSLNKGDDDKNGNGRDQTIECLTIGWWLKPYVRTKFEVSRHRFEDASLPEFNQLSGAIGVVF